MKQVLSLAFAAMLAVSAQAQVTFNVDMSCAPDGVDNLFVTGPWCGWCANADYNTMIDPDGDGVFTVTVGDLTGEVEYKYAINGFAGQEDLVNDMVDGADCAPVTDYSSYANRTVMAGPNAVTNDYYGTCDGTCNDETVISTETQVTFHVDMSGYAGTEDPSQVTWNSGANSWCGNCAPLDDLDGDGIYSITVPLTGDTVEYKFAIGAWVDQEDLEPETSCTKTTYDESAPNGCCYVNRFVALNGEEAIDMPVVCWNSCQACGAEPVAGCTDAEACNYNAEASTDDGSCVYGDGPIVELTVEDALCFGGEGLLSLDSATMLLLDDELITVEVLGAEGTLPAGDYIFVATDTLGCSSETAFTVGEPDELVIDITILVQDSGAGDGQAEATVSGGTPEYTVTWSDIIGTPVDPTALAEGTYTVTVVDANGCTATTTLTMTPDNITELALLQGSVFPVPATDVLNVQLGRALTSDAALSVLDMQGRVVATATMRAGTQMHAIDASSWTKGAYIVQLVTDEARASWNFVK